MGSGGLRGLQNRCFGAEASKGWFDSDTPPPPLSRGQRILLWSIGLAIALSRIPAVSRTIWDWDEALFALALRDYDVTLHHPHPPGFPLFIALANLFRPFASSDFRALQSVTFLSGVLLFPAMFLLGRALRMRFGAALASATILPFLPNVWFFGGTAFSDVPALAAEIGAVGYLFRSRATGRRDYFIGSILLGCAIAFRPQNVIIGAYPWLAATAVRFRERKSDLFGGAAAVIAVVVLSYGGAAIASGSWIDYVNAIRGHQRWVANVDSYRNPGRPPLRDLVYAFAVDPYHAGKVSMIMAAFAALGLMTLRRRGLEALLTFGPFFLFAWLMLDSMGMSRLSIGYMPLLALLAGGGIYFVSCAGASMVGSTPAVRGVLQMLFVAMVVGRLAQWMAPVFREVRESDSPPVQSVNWIRQHLDPKSATIFVHGSMWPLAELLLSDYRYKLIEEEVPHVAGDIQGDAWWLAEMRGMSANSIELRRSRDRLPNLVRERYFEVSITPLANVIQFNAGWWQESTSIETWPSMASQSKTTLVPLAGRGDLQLTLHIPKAYLPRQPVVTMIWNGREISRTRPVNGVVRQQFSLESAGEKPNELRIAIDPGVPCRVQWCDELGAALRHFYWGPEGGAKKASPQRHRDTEKAQ